ncbi:MAG TPA: hypothetical protein VKY31_02865, partial [Terriglobia bacterium]|nr:hypothetical protein [Terriglobia bacterium]
MPDSLLRAVAGPFVNIDQYGALAPKVAQQSFFGRAHDVADCLAVIAGWDSHQQINFADADELPDKIVRKETFLAQCPLHELRRLNDGTGLPKLRFIIKF